MFSRRTMTAPTTLPMNVSSNCKVGSRQTLKLPLGPRNVGQKDYAPRSFLLRLQQLLRPAAISGGFVGLAVLDVNPGPLSPDFRIVGLQFGGLGKVGVGLLPAFQFGVAPAAGQPHSWLVRMQGQRNIKLGGTLVQRLEELPGPPLEGFQVGVFL